MSENTWDYKAAKRATAEAFDDPQVGDCFSEAYSFWVYVVAVAGDRVATMEANPPCSFPKDGKLKWQTRDEYRKRFAYNSRPGYWVLLADRGNDVSGWLDECLEGPE